MLRQTGLALVLLRPMVGSLRPAMTSTRPEPPFERQADSVNKASISGPSVAKHSVWQIFQPELTFLRSERCLDVLPFLGQRRVETVEAAGR